MINGNTGHIEIIDTLSNITYKVQFTQVDYATSGQPLYYAQVTYPVGTYVGYLFSVAQTVQGLFYIGVVNQGRYIQGAYLVGTSQIDMTKYSRIIRLDLVVTPQILID